MAHLRKASVLVSGLGSVGVEIAKNLILGLLFLTNSKIAINLGGVRHVTLHDQKDLTYKDLSAHFYASEADGGHNRVRICAKQLAELNDTVNCAVSTDALTEEFVKQFDVCLLN